MQCRRRRRRRRRHLRPHPRPPPTAAAAASGGQSLEALDRLERMGREVGGDLPRDVRREHSAEVLDETIAGLPARREQGLGVAGRPRRAQLAAEHRARDPAVKREHGRLGAGARDERVEQPPELLGGLEACELDGRIRLGCGGDGRVHGNVSRAAGAGLAAEIVVGGGGGVVGGRRRRRRAAIGHASQAPALMVALLDPLRPREARRRQLAHATRAAVLLLLSLRLLLLLLRLLLRVAACAAACGGSAGGRRAAAGRRGSLGAFHGLQAGLALGVPWPRQLAL